MKDSTIQGKIEAGRQYNRLQKLMQSSEEKIRLNAIRIFNQTFSIARYAKFDDEQVQEEKQKEPETNIYHAIELFLEPHLPKDSDPLAPRTYCDSVKLANELIKNLKKSIK